MGLKAVAYRELHGQLTGLFAGERNGLANAANLSALLYEALPGHIACDAASRSEIVVPLIQKSQLLGVLDLDSPQLARFDQEDGIGLSALAALLLECSDLKRYVDSGG
jgi:putative methionine-R-sulfoxide reductase with GAF domain